MSLFDTGVKKKKFKQEKWVSRLEAIRDLEDILFSDPYEEECLYGTWGPGRRQPFCGVPMCGADL